MYETLEQTWDIFLMSSRDGFHWNWIDRSVPFLGRGEVGAYDPGLAGKPVRVRLEMRNAALYSLQFVQ